MGAVRAERTNAISCRASFTIWVVELTMISASIFLRASTVEFREITNLYSASKKVNLDSAIEEESAADRIPSDSREYNAEPASDTTPSERSTVERITLVASDCASA